MTTTILSIGNRMRSQKAYTFLELMVTVSILSVGIVGIYRALLTSLDYQSELSQRLYAINILEDEISLLENQYRATAEDPSAENGKVIEAVLDHRPVPFTLSVSPGLSENIEGLLPVELALTWPSRGHNVTLKRYTYLANLNLTPPPPHAPSKNQP